MNRGVLACSPILGRGHTEESEHCVPALKFSFLSCISPARRIPATLNCLGIVVTLGIAMLFRDGEIVMRILSKPQLKELVLYSPQHIARLEKAGLFPKRVQLGPNRVGWLLSEVQDWLQERLDQRL